MNTLKTWEEMNEQQRDKLREYVRCELNRFSYEEVDQATHDYVLDQIDQLGLEPLRGGTSIGGAWDSWFLVDGKHYQLLGVFTSEEITVSLITDNCPEKGPMLEASP